MKTPMKKYGKGGMHGPKARKHKGKKGMKKMHGSSGRVSY